MPLSRQARWYAFGLAVLASLVGLRMGGNVLAFVPVFLTGLCLVPTHPSVSAAVSTGCIGLYAVFLFISSLTVGRYYLPSFLALLAAIALALVLERPKRSAS